MLRLVNHKISDTNQTHLLARSGVQSSARPRSAYVPQIYIYIYMVGERERESVVRREGFKITEQLLQITK